jgi:hypothetical protein
MKLVNLQTQQYEDVPDDKLHEAIASGQYGSDDPNARVAIRTQDGQLGTVPLSGAQEAFEGGAQAVPQAEYHKAQVEQRRSGIGDMLASGAEGALRGATLGLSDAAAVAGAEAFGGDKLKEQVRQHLAEEQEAHPWISGAGEFAGAVAPTLLSGGAGAAVEGAEAAAGGGRMAALLRAVGAPTRAVSALGELGSKAALKAIPGAEGAMGRIARAAIRAGTSGAIEGGLYSGGNEISEDVLGDHELTAEKFAAAVGHGALWGAMVGAPVGAGAEALSTVGAKIQPGLEGQADKQAWRSISSSRRFAKQAERVGGTEAVGETLRETGAIPSSPLEAAMLSPEKQGTRIEAALDGTWKKMQPLLENGGTVGWDAVDGAIQKEIDAHAKVAGRGKIVDALEKYRDDLREKLGVAGPTTERVQRTGEQVGQYLRDNPPAMAQFHATGKVPDEALWTHKITPGEGAVSLGDLMEQRKGLDQSLRWQSTAAPPPELEAMRNVRRSLADLELTAADNGAPGAAKKLKQLRTQYARLSVAQDAIDEKIAAAGQKPQTSLVGAMGLMHAIGHLAAGNIPGALASVGGVVAHHFVRERGAAVAAASLGRLASLDLLARGSMRIDDALAKGISEFLESPSRKGAAPSVEDSHDAYEAARTMAPPVAKPGLTAKHVDDAFPGLPLHAPKTAGALAGVVGAGASYLSTVAPKIGGPPTPLMPERKPPAEAAHVYTQAVDGVHDPIGMVTRAMQTGRVSQPAVDAFAKTKPKLYAQFQNQVREAIAGRTDTPFDKIITLSKLAKMPLDPFVGRQGVAWLQSAYQKPAAQAPQGRQTHGAPKRKLTGLTDDVQLSTGQVHT